MLFACGRISAESDEAGGMDASIHADSDTRDRSEERVVTWVDAGACGLCPLGSECAYAADAGCDAAPQCAVRIPNCINPALAGCTCDGRRIRWGCLIVGYVERPLRGDMACWLPDASTTD